MVASLLLLVIPPAVAQYAPVFQYAIFYNMDLEICPGAGMTINGKVHSNDNIWATGAGSGPSALTFSDLVSASGFYTNSRSLNDPQSWNPGNINFTITQNNPLSHVDQLTMPIGTNNNPSMANGILQLPPPNLNVPNAAAYSPTGQVYLYNASDLIITNDVSGTNWTLLYDNQYNSPELTSVPPDMVVKTTNTVHGVTSYFTNSYYSFVTNVTFYDYREASTVKAIRLDVAKLNRWLTNNSALGGNQYNLLNINGSTSKGHGINSVYVYNSVPLAASQLPGVQLINGQQLPSAGLTMSTAQPLYVVGNYNIQTNASGTQALTPGSTTNGATVPAALMGDAITILSSYWSDSYNSSTSLGIRNASSTTVNAAALEGIVQSYTSGGTKYYSGGVENFLRLLEDWSGGDVLTYNGSIVVLFPSQYATNVWQNPGAYYNPPTRNWGFDVNFLKGQSYLPPLTPLLLDTNPPLIIVQPQSQTNNAGSNTVFSVTASAGVGFGVNYLGSNPNLLNYQWDINGTNISGATNVTLVLTNIQSSQAGIYTVLVASFIGTTTSSNAVLTVLALPSITAQPTNVTALAGDTATFTVTVSGTDPLNYQWAFNNTNLDDATNLTLTLSDLTTNESGTYSITVTNIAGSVTSSNAVLSVYASAASALNGASLTADNNIQFMVTGVPGFYYVVEASTNLIDWVPLFTNTSPFIFTDTNTSSFQQQFYRSIYTP